MHTGQQQLAERRLLSGLRRLHRREPMTPDFRLDAVVALARDGGQRPASHRGAAPLSLTDADLIALLDDLAARGEVVRDAHRIRLADHQPQLGPAMRRRADALLAELGSAGASPPRAESIARRLGLPDGVVDALRKSGELVTLAPGIDYPREALEVLLGQLRGRDLTAAQVRDELRTSRRYAAALLDALNH